LKNRKVIAVDVDEVFSPLLPNMLPWYNKKYGTNHTMDQYKTRSMQESFGKPLEHWLVEFVEYIKERWEEDTQPIEGAVESVKNIMQHHDVFFMTARDTSVHHITERFLKKHLGDNFTKLISLNYADKGEALKKEGADLLIDDSEHNIRSAKEAGIDGWLFGGYLPHIDVGDLPKVDSWSDVMSKLELSPAQN